MTILKQIEIKGYRSIKHASIELRPLNVLIGANGAGKSNFVSFFKMLNEMMAGRLQEYIGRHGRAQSILHFGPKVTSELEGVISFDDVLIVGTYSMKLSHAAGDILIFSSETLHYPSTISEKNSHGSSFGGGYLESRIVEFGNEWAPQIEKFRQLMTDCRVYHFHDTSATSRIRQFCYLNDNRRLTPDAGNLAAMLYAYQQKSPVVYNRIVSTVRKILPEFDRFDLNPSRLNENEIILNWRKRGYDYLFGPHQLSDGSLRAMALCTLFLQPEVDLPSVIILDEPELGLHPHALEILAGLIRAASTKSQVIVATQSQTFLNFFAPSEIITVECRDGRSTFHRLEESQLKEWLEDYSVGELWQRNVIGGGPLP